MIKRDRLDTRRSAPHRKVERALELIGIAFQSECEDFSPYRLDIYLSEWHMCIEVDGPTHSPKADGKRDDTLAERGIKTYRISGKQIVLWDSFMLAEWLTVSIEDAARTADERKAIWQEARFHQV